MRAAHGIGDEDGSAGDRVVAIGIVRNRVAVAIAFGAKRSRGTNRLNPESDRPATTASVAALGDEQLSGTGPSRGRNSGKGVVWPAVVLLTLDHRYVATKDWSDRPKTWRLNSRRSVSHGSVPRRVCREPKLGDLIMTDEQPQMPDHPSGWFVVALERGADGKTGFSFHRALQDTEGAELNETVTFIHELTAFREFRRAIEAAQRWIETISRASSLVLEELALPHSTEVAIRLDTEALAKAALECDGDIRARAISQSDTPGQSARRQVFEVRRSATVATPEYLRVLGLGSRARDGTLRLVNADGAVRIAGAEALEPTTIASALLGRLAQLVFASLEMLQAEFEAAAQRIDEAIHGIADGTPTLAYFAPDADSPSMQLRLTDLPLLQIAAVRHFMASVPTISSPEALAIASANLMQAGERPRVEFGGINVSGAARNIQATSSLDVARRATISIDVELAGSAPIDYWAAVSVDMIHGPRRGRLFSGAVRRVEAEASGLLSLECEDVIEMTEHNLGGIWAANIDPVELTQSVLRQSGLPDDAIKFTSLPSGAILPPGPSETFEVFVPIEGVEVVDAVEFGNVAVVPSSACDAILSRFAPPDEATTELATTFMGASGYLKASVVAEQIDAAETLGFSAIEVAIAWIVAHERYGFARLPNGDHHEFHRETALSPPRMLPAVLVAGQQTSRQWMRWRVGGLHPRSRDIAAPAEPALATELTAKERRSLLAINRASVSDQVDAQLQALWEALESYASQSRPSKRFTKCQLKSLRTLAPDWMNDDQRDRFAQAIGQMNEPPLLAKLRHQLELDAVPLTADEEELLFVRLRAGRNDVAHGRSIAQPPTRSEALLAISVVSRIILFGIHARIGSLPVVDT